MTLILQVFLSCYVQTVWKNGRFHHLFSSRSNKIAKYTAQPTNYLHQPAVLLNMVEAKRALAVAKRVARKQLAMRFW
ncbi:MAG: hypothetical protein H6668_02995 [Ardenticatenaceae bacterium]|nr:hypothetical protein [Ardenticatenaceae bacterium]